VVTPGPRRISFHHHGEANGGSFFASAPSRSSRRFPTMPWRVRPAAEGESEQLFVSQSVHQITARGTKHRFRLRTRSWVGGGRACETPCPESGQDPSLSARAVAETGASMRVFLRGSSDGAGRHHCNAFPFHDGQGQSCIHFTSPNPRAPLVGPITRSEQMPGGTGVTTLSRRIEAGRYIVSALSFHPHAASYATFAPTS
jgi:hypothetical protein